MALWRKACEAKISGDALTVNLGTIYSLPHLTVTLPVEEEIVASIGEARQHHTDVRIIVTVQEQVMRWPAVRPSTQSA